MLELGVGADIVRGVGFMVVGLFAAALVAALTLPKPWKAKTAWAVLVLAIFIGPAIPSIVRGIEHKQRYAKAKALFDERCKSAGERIFKTAAGIDGLVLLNIRPAPNAASRANQMWPDAALPDEFGGEWYLISFLGWEQKQGGRPGPVNLVPTSFPGYKFVDVRIDANTYERYRLVEESIPIGKHWKLGPGQRHAEPSRFAVAFENLVSPEDRELWVAGTRISIVDTATGELLAERTSFAFEPGLGSTQGFRQPWGFAIGCPQFVHGAQTRNFVERVLKKPEEQK